MRLGESKVERRADCFSSMNQNHAHINEVTSSQIYHNPFNSTFREQDLVNSKETYCPFSPNVKKIPAATPGKEQEIYKIKINRTTEAFLKACNKELRYFITAILDDDPDTVLKCLKDNPSIDVNGFVPFSCELSDTSISYLQLSCLFGLNRICRILLNHGALVDIKTKERAFTPLHFSVVGNHYDCCKLLLERNAKLNEKDTKHGMTPIECAIKFERPKIIILLVWYSLDRNDKLDILNQKDFNNMPLIMMSYVESGYQINNTIEFLLQACSNLAPDTIFKGKLNINAVDFKSRTLYDHMTKVGDVENMMLLLKYGAKTGRIEKSLHWAASKKDKYPKKDNFFTFILALNNLCLNSDASLETCKYPYHLLAKLEPREKNMEKVIAHCQNNFGNKVSKQTLNWFIALQIFQHFGVSLDVRDESGNTALHYAAIKGKRDLVDFLIRHGATTFLPDASGYFPLHLAIMHKNFALARHILRIDNENLSKYINKNSENRSELTPLMLLCSIEDKNPSHYLFLFKEVLEVCDVVKTCSSGFNCFHAAAGCNNTFIMQLLIDHIRKRNKRGWKLDKKGRSTLVKDVLQRRVKNTGYSPLHYAADAGKIAVSKVLIANGANPHSIDFKKQRPIDLALKMNKLELVHYLRKYCLLELNQETKVNRLINDEK